MTIGMQGRHLNPAAENRTLPAGKITRQTYGMTMTQALGNNQFSQRLADDIFPASPKRRFRGGIEIQYFAFVVHGDDGIKCDTEDGGFEVLTFAQRLLGQLLLRNVAGETTGVDKFSIFPEHVGGNKNVPDGAVFAAQPRLAIFQRLSTAQFFKDFVDNRRVRMKF